MEGKKLIQSALIRFVGPSLPCEFESSEKGILETNSVAPWESLTIEKPKKNMVTIISNDNR